MVLFRERKLTEILELPKICGLLYYLIFINEEIKAWRGYAAEPGSKARKQRAQMNLIQVYLASKTMYVVVYIILSLPTLCGLKVFSKITMKSLMGAYYAPDSPHIYVNSFHLKNNPEKGCHRIPSIWIRKLRINNLSNHAELRTGKKMNLKSILLQC